ncbi:A disintegrin and metalloproteinase with thrombospondin motifs like [Diachasmimorpha longicaudata]|uniref:A disintegrin and metalloproteinase with thrombospondin motifs like n=1 Tax=Diachasmimorpha longicaudata TaxID=58733 RepID=UPI0030B8E52D
MVDNWIGNEECAKCQENARSFIELCPLRPNTVVPRILVVVAHDIFEIFDKNHIDAIVYLVAFWNGVDLRYRYFENPKFRLNIAGIVLTEDSKALEYMTAHVIDETTVEVFDTQDGSRRYWYARGHDIPFDTYDVVVTMTSKQMCEFPPDEKEKGVCKGGILGIADVGGACARSDSSKELLNVAIIQDKTAFNGIHTAVHELAHLFGAKHDGIMRTQECSPDDGYIMSSGPRLNDKSAQWSNCTLKDIQHFLDNNPNCLNNNIEDGEVLPVYLPGKFLDADGQCYWVMKTKACNMSSSICRSLSCQHPFSGACTKIGHPAADGTTCESEKICLYGECIHESMIYS